MNQPTEIQKLFPDLMILADEALSGYTTFQLGGACPFLIDGPTGGRLPALIQKLNEMNLSFLVIGQGSNLVISDEGLDCAVIRFCSDIPKIKAKGTRVTVSGDTLLDDLALFTTENGVGDLSYCTGIPGTVGGGIAGNAGAFGRQMGDHLVSVQLLDRDGTIRTVFPGELDFAYRHSRLKESGEIILAATFELPPLDQQVLQAERERILNFRKEHHPDWRTTPCAGSVFRNIDATSAAERRQAAGYFLEEAGARDLKAGGAKIFEKHANIIIGGTGCTAQNVHDLSERMIRAVQDKFDLTLVREVRFLGQFKESA